MKIWILYQTDEYGEWEILKVAWRESVVRNHFIKTAREILLDNPEACRDTILAMSADEVETAICKHYSGQPYYQGMGWRSIRLPRPSLSQALGLLGGKTSKNHFPGPVPGVYEKGDAMIFCTWCETEAVRVITYDTGKRTPVCRQCGDVFEFGQEDFEATTVDLSDVNLVLQPNGKYREVCGACGDTQDYYSTDICLSCEEEL